MEKQRTVFCYQSVGALQGYGTPISVIRFLVEGNKHCEKKRSGEHSICSEKKRVLGVSFKDNIGNSGIKEGYRQRSPLGREYQNIVKWLWHKEVKDELRLTNRICKAEVERSGRKG